MNRTQTKLGLIHSCLFTAVVTCASRLLILREHLRRHAATVSQELRTHITRHSIPSAHNMLDAAFAQPRIETAKAGLLICHGIGETVDHWQTAQRLLAEAGIASLVFDYSGYGRSTGRINASQCEFDAKQALAFLQSLLPQVPLSLLGYSMGSGVAAAIVHGTDVQHLVLCAAFTSLRKAARSLGVPGMLSSLLPNLWDNEEALRSCRIPVLLVHGEEDELLPPAMAQSLAAICVAPCQLEIIPNLSHNAPIFHAQNSYWSRIACCLLSSTQRNHVDRSPLHAVPQAK